MQKGKQYKALMCDVDGTLIINSRSALPSPKVTEAINQAAKLVHIGVATSRCYPQVDHVTEHLNLNGPSVVNGGAEVMDIQTRKVYYKQPLEKKDIKTVWEILKKNNIPIMTCDGVKENCNTPTNKMPENSYFIFSQGLDQQVVDELTEIVSQIPRVNVHTTNSWTIGKKDFLVTHAKATKQHGIFEVAKLLGIETHEIIGIGDGYNDFPLLMACGLKVAMGNAVPELKEIADYVAPTVEEDGVADVIEKFIL